MRLNRPSFANRLGKRFAQPLSRIACAGPIYPLTRMLDAYLNFIIGKGSGGELYLNEEAEAAAACIKRPRPVVFDVGANLGLWTQSLLKKIPGAKVYAFDPSPGCQSAIREKALPDVTVMPYALGEVSCERPLYFRSATDPSASLHARHDTPFENDIYRQTTVRVRTLDEVLGSEKIDFLDFMKMDLEGHELFALRGARAALAARKIGALSFEFSCSNVNSRTFFRDLWDILTAADFAIYRITPSGKRTPISDYYEDSEYFRGTTNYVARLKF